MMQLKFTHASNYLDDDEYDENKIIKRKNRIRVA